MSQDQNGIDSNGFKRGIVNTLIDRPNSSCKLVDLPNHVYKTLGITLRGKKRQALLAELNRALGNLKRAEIVQVYKAKNIRVRLAKNYQPQWQSMLKRMERGGARQVETAEMFPLNDNDSLPPESLTSLVQIRSNERKNLLPPLPEAIYDFESIEEYPDESECDDFSDEERIALIHLVGPESLSKSSDVDTSPTDDISFQEALESELNRLDEYAVEAVPGKLSILFPSSAGLDTCDAFWSETDDTLMLQMHFPFVSDVAIPLLQLSASIAWESIPGIENIDGIWHFVLRRKLHISNRNVQFAHTEIIKFVSEVRRARGLQLAVLSK